MATQRSSTGAVDSRDQFGRQAGQCSVSNANTRASPRHASANRAARPWPGPARAAVRTLAISIASRTTCGPEAREVAACPMVEPLFDESRYAEQDRAATGWPRITPPHSTTNSAFVSHTSPDSPACQRWVLPAIERAVSDPVFLDYHSFRNLVEVRDAYARNILVNLRCSEHLIVVLSESALSSTWVKEEVSWWVRRRGTEETTVVALDRSARDALHPRLSEAAVIDFTWWKWLAGWRLTWRLRRVLFTSGWFVIKRWPRRVHRSMLKRRLQ